MKLTIAEPASALVAHTFRIAGVLNTEIKEGAGQGGLRGLMPGAANLHSAAGGAAWTIEHRGPMSQVALALARQSGKLGEGEDEGYDSAVVRVNDPVALTEVRKRLTELGFGSFSIVDELDQIRTVFLIIDSVLGLLGGISLLVASFGIANTMIMSILERTREIGIMKAIGAEDREIKLIFFFEAAVIGVLGGVIGSARGLGNRRDRQSSGLSVHSQTAGRVVCRLFSLPPWLSSRRDSVCAGRFDPRRALSGRTRRAHRSGPSAAA